MSDSLPNQKGENDAAVRRESPLHYMIASAEQHSHSDCGVVIHEEALKGHLNLRGDAESESFRAGIAQVLGVELPVVPSTCARNGEVSVYWLGPSEWLVIVDAGTEAGVQAALRENLSGHFAVTDLSGGQTLVKLSGKDVEMLLKKASVYDFHPSRFAVGRCVQTTFAKATALVCKTGDDSFELVIRRSFADYLFRWIADASREYGLEAS